MKFRSANPTQLSSMQWLFGAYAKSGQSDTQRSTTDRRSSGFTLIELLVALIIGAIITTLVLGFTVSLMRNNQREASRSNTQREVQAALDYINRDVREAVYVYDGECLRTTGIKSPTATPATAANTCPGLLNYLPADLNTATNLPILAFWRLDPLPDQLLTSVCGDPATARSITNSNPALRPLPGSPIDKLPCVGRKMYTLVVYSLNNNEPNPNDRIWNGRSRITRYTLAPYTDGNGTTETVGWYSPLATSFPNWPYNASPRNGAPNLPTTRAANWAGNNQVLVDFIDDRPSDSSTTNIAECPTVNNIAKETEGGFYATPAQGGAGGYAAAAALSRRTFYACVRGGDRASLNQEVIVRIQGNAAGQPGVALNQGNVPVTMETRILTRGVLEKGS
jgi:prepilin-type N-terminal cleavage/methylation domain-containing protein